MPPPFDPQEFRAFDDGNHDIETPEFARYAFPGANSPHITRQPITVDPYTNETQLGDRAIPCTEPRQAPWFPDPNLGDLDSYSYGGFQFDDERGVSLMDFHSDLHAESSMNNSVGNLPAHGDHPASTFGFSHPMNHPQIEEILFPHTEHIPAQSQFVSMEPFIAGPERQSRSKPPQQVARNLERFHAHRERISCTSPGCTKTFGRGAEFRRHLSSVHGGATFRCLVSPCNKTYPRADKLKEHMKKEHGMQLVRA